mmetsp:Transcript_128771/g.181688  ORF Transcript_128771/g.181688 Transcript_128771/m.181688 type:complete len:271 (+) Transcript_128771:20-832(+)
MFKVVLVLAAVVCVTAQRGVQCGGACTVDAECQSVCRQCIFGKCGSGCNFPCRASGNCLDPNCAFCYQSHCTSSPHHKCGQTCIHNSDCEQSPANECKVCQNGKCIVPCGAACKSDANCLGETCKKCTRTTKGTLICAAQSHRCGQQCTTNDQCDQSGVCSQCNLGRCGAGCGFPCTKNSQCLDTNCPVCNATKKCARTTGGGKCGSKCLLNSDCSGDPYNCGHCIFGVCGAACQDHCLKNSDCLTQGCQVCGKIPKKGKGKFCTYPSEE